MTDAQTRLSSLEETKALIDAGINPDIDTWNDATLEAASKALDEAQQAKLARLNPRHKPAEYTLADMASDLGDYFDKTPAEHAS